MDDLLRGLRTISLAALDERAALLRRVDRKYIADPEQLAQLIERLGEDHDVLEIDGRRAFSYETVYFDTADLRCFREHAEDVRPRFKARTRCYVDAGDCVFEVKVKRRDGDTDKRQTDDLDDSRALLESTLRDAGIEPPSELEEVLRTSFRRTTLAARDGGARLTIDRDVTLARMDGEAVRPREGLALMQTRSEDGESPGDRALAALVRADETGEVEGAHALLAP